MSLFLQPRRKNSMNEPLTLASHHDANLINPGPPALYQLNTDRKYIDRNNEKVRRWTYGRKDKKKQNKIILLVGETGAGKTTLINTMTNYLLGVKFEDQEFYQITEEEKHEDQSQSQSSEITVCEVFVEENPTSLTIIDTPGYGDNEGYKKDVKISEYLNKLFSDEDGIHYIDAVCFVMKATQNRLSGKELYIFHSVLSLFGRDIKDNIVFLLTHSDGGPPTDALNAIEKAKIPCRRDEDNQPVHYLFNNRQNEKREKLYEKVLKTTWERGEGSLNEFFTLLEENNRKSVEMTLDVLKERRRLEACVNNLKDRINEEEVKMKELRQIQQDLKEIKDKIEKCENLPFTVKKTYKEKVPIVNEWPWNSNATCCSFCEENCHEWGCSWAADPSRCLVLKDNHCTVCSGKCHHSKHVRENKKYVTKTEMVIIKFYELKEKYDGIGYSFYTILEKNRYENTKMVHYSNKKEFDNKHKSYITLDSVLKNIKKEKSDQLAEAYISITTLCKVALKADSALTLQHLDFLIPKLKEEGKEDWVKNLEDLRKIGEEQKNKGALCHLLEFGRTKETKNG